MRYANAPMMSFGKVIQMGVHGFKKMDSNIGTIRRIWDVAKPLIGESAFTRAAEKGLSTYESVRQRLKAGKD